MVAVSLEIEIFVSQHCPSCPEACRVLRQFARTRDDDVVVERAIEAEEARVSAHGYGLFATPAVVIDGRTVLYGIPSLEQLRGLCPDPSSTRQSDL